MSRRRLASTLLLHGAALTGLFAPWIAHRAAGLAFNLYDLYDLVMHLPQVESQALHLQLQTLRIPFLALALSGVLALRRAPRGVKAAALALALLLAVEVLPPYPTALTAWKLPGWQVPFFWAVGTMVAALLAAVAGARLPGRAVRLVAVGMLVGAAAGSLRSFWRLRPALGTLYDAPIRAGWGLWLYAGATVALLGWWLRPEGEEVKEKMDVKKARRLLARHRRRLMALPDVVSVGVGEVNGEAVILVGLRRPDAAAGIPAQVEGVPVRTRVVGTIRAQTEGAEGDRD